MDGGEHHNDKEVVQALDAPVAPPINAEFDSSLGLPDLEGIRIQHHEVVQVVGLQQDLMKDQPEEHAGLHDKEDGQATTGSSTSMHPPSDSSSPRSSPSPSDLSSALLASLKELGEHSDHSLLPRSLHQIAEACFLEEDYERAIQFIQLERLYHERLLSNLTTLQEKWEHQCKSAVRHRSSPIGSEQMDTLRHMCRTHQRPLLGVPKHVFVDQVLNSSLTTKRPSDVAHSLGTGSIAETQGMDLLALETDCGMIKAEDAVPCSRGEVPPHTGSSPKQLMVTPTPALGGAEETQLLPAKHWTEGFIGDQLMDSCLQKQEEVRQVDREGGSRNKSSPTKNHTTNNNQCVGVGDVIDGQLAMQGPTMPSGTGDETVIADRDSSDHVTPVGVEPWEGHTEAHHEMDEDEEEEELEEQDLADDEVGEEVLECEPGEEKLGVGMEQAGVGLDSLDDLAKRIRVEEVTPADGLVSILKRRVTVEGDTAQEGATLRQTKRRRVRFREPDDGLDQDEAGGASCLILLLLCIVTVVISVGGTAVYCLFGDQESTICTDFSHNMHFYLGHMQRGVDELKHWFSASS
ncbi:consortin, connexin sorting protein b [Scleropages formosus]|uniref:Consortin, connexin sorting protein b n=1 Tax=Scleropages formosus TaxID=113540 RepID=A0A8C9QZ99_SCLFO|nr:consortin-like [Scleropages formosus]